MTKLSIETDGEKSVIVRRRFRAAPEAVFRAHIDAELLRKWMFGPPGWTMSVCESDPKPGGAIRFEWAGPAGATMRVTGTYKEVIPHSRLRHTEIMHMPDPSPENEVLTEFTATEDSGTLVVVTMTLPTPEDRAAMLASGMEDGMEASYAKLDALDL
ncbi:SRPBCC domain-containing protein [Flavimaricola marinus]|uniref:Activator of Hsp90 ATPase homologue 1/2-like C-terminal domain-containing protein n=1 Tax=Flavimaricola marinus TaxID=1819565 RepID=A0A238LFT9_9RHOB|nr:SRPBCC domain-containing protein [Flavimaricola marinus]SMY08284.1 hypothetical protein LOM8899_02434 [Flavimaricola marinus]